MDAYEERFQRDKAAYDQNNEHARTRHGSLTALSDSQLQTRRLCRTLQLTRLSMSIPKNLFPLTQQ
jgi:hypothetical protein